MALSKFSLKSDAVANLYRAAFYLAQGERKTGLEFLEKARLVLGDKVKLNIKEDNLVLAEMVLDLYKLYK